MRVKVGERVYDPKDTPIMVILSDVDKAKIAAMGPESRRYAAVPDEMSLDELRDFMDTGFSQDWLAAGAK